MVPARTARLALPLLLAVSFPLAAPSAQSTPQRATPSTPLGYFRFPSISGETIVFTAEGDLWRVGIAGGVAQRLTTHPAEETHGVISPDGKTLAFSAAYEGSTEVYTMALDGSGGAPVRRTYEGGTATVVGWTPRGEILYSTRRYTTLPGMELALLDPRTGRSSLVPLAQASDGAYDAGGTLFFTRFRFQGSYTKRYRGGTAQSVWKFARGDREATPLTADYPGTSRTPMVWRGRVYFLSDRDGTMNLWSMAEDGSDLRQHTRHTGFDVQSPSLSDGRIVYQLGADLWLYDIATGADRIVPITLVSDFDQMRERWVHAPMDWVNDVHLSPTGDRVVLTARGQAFVAPARQGRIVAVTRDKAIRVRTARFMPDGKSLLTLSDESGETEFWLAPASGLGARTQLTHDAKVLRWDGVPSPDGKLIAHTDKDRQLWLYDVAAKTNTRIAVSPAGDIRELAWSPDSRWLAYTAPAANQLSQIFLYSVERRTATAVTTDRYESMSPVWTPDGKWLAFLSDRFFQSLVTSPWGPRQPEPFFDRQTKIYLLALRAGERSPFEPDDELHPGSAASERSDTTKHADSAAAGGRRDRAPRPVIVDLDGIERRLIEVPVPAGNYRSLDTDGKRLYYISAGTAGDQKFVLQTLAIGNDGAKPETFAEGVRSYELSLDRKKILLRRGNDLYVVDAGARGPQNLEKSKVDLSDWMFHFDPRAEWRQMFVDAWRLERDYFYDRNMHGLDWAAIRDRYLPLVDRVTDRAELSDVLAQMVGELSALHIFVRGGDMRSGDDEDILPASLGATLERDEGAGGYRVTHIYLSDPDIPDEVAPLARPGVDVAEGDVITMVNGVPTLSAPDIGYLLRNQAGKQVLLRVKPKGGGTPRDVVVRPIPLRREADLRYDEWEYTRRLAVESQSNNQIGYVHLRAMGGANIAEWVREYYPVFNRQGLIIDVRHNTGGNIDSWILEKLLRKAWFYWQPRVGDPYWNMQYAFRGHVVVLVDQFTASDGEAFAEGFRRLGLGKVIGTRTWGGEIWLSQSNRLVDRGIATAAETGVYGPEGVWLIEGHGVEPDIVVDNLPHATFQGEDAQLAAAVKFLQEEIRKNPVPVPVAPAYPNKAVKTAVGGGSGAGKP